MLKGAFYRQIHDYMITFEKSREIYHIYSPEGEEILQTRSALEAEYTLKNRV